MNLVPFTYNGSTISDGINISAILQTEGQVIPSAEIIEVARTNNFPVYAGKEFNSKLLPIMVEFIGTAVTRDQINNILDPTDTTEHAFVCKDTDDSNKQYYVNAVVKSQPDFGANHAEYILYTDNPVWTAIDSSQGIWYGTSSPGTILGTVTGNREAYPTIGFRPLAAKSDGFAYKRFVEMRNPNTGIAFASYPLNIVDDGSGTGTWDSSTLVAGGTITSAAGDDVRFIVDGAETDRWFGDFNSGTTKVWSNVSLQPLVELTLASALGTTSVGEIEFAHKKSADKKKNLKALKKIASNGILKTPTGEYLTYDELEVKDFKISTITRGAKNSSVGTVAAGGTLIYIEHDAWLVYGKSAVSAPSQNDEYQPAISLTDSTQLTHKWDLFGSLDGLRSLCWFPAVVNSRGGDSMTYGGNQGTTDTDPFTDMGMMATSYIYGNRAQAEKANLTWDLYHPAGGTQIIFNGKKYQATNSYPTYSRIQRSSNGKDFTTVSNIADPASYGTWESFAGTNSFSSSYNRWRWQLSGNLKAASDISAFLEVNDFTMSLDPTNVPIVTIQAEQGNYRAELTIENTTTGEAIFVDQVMGLNEALVIDCVNNSAYIADDNTMINSSITTNTDRDYWLRLVPGVNTIVLTEDGLGSATFTLVWYEQKL